METKNTGTKTMPGKSHMKHMWMMAVCCGLPILGFIAIGVLGITMPSLETVLLLVCPIGMVAMMYMMRRDNQGKAGSCCESEETEDETVIKVITKDDTAKPRKVGSLEA